MQITWAINFEIIVDEIGQILFSFEVELISSC